MPKVFKTIHTLYIAPLIVGVISGLVVANSQYFKLSKWIAFLKKIPIWLLIWPLIGLVTLPLIIIVLWQIIRIIMKSLSTFRAILRKINQSENQKRELQNEIIEVRKQAIRKLMIVFHNIQWKIKETERQKQVLRKQALKKVAVTLQQVAWKKKQEESTKQVALRKILFLLYQIKNLKMKQWRPYPVLTKLFKFMR